MKRKKGKDGFDFGRFLFGGLFVTFVCVFIWLMSDMLFAPSLKGYEKVPCRIVQSSVKMEDVRRFVFRVEFSYERKGKQYKSSSLCRPGRRDFEFSHLASRLPLLEKFAIGSDHECLVNPNDPWDAVLDVEDPVEHPGDLGGAGPVIAAIVLFLFFSVGVFIMATAFPAVRRLGTPRVKKALVAVFILLFGLPFATIGVSGVVHHLAERSEAESFAPVQAKVLYSGIYSFHSGGRNSHTSYGVRVGYEYTVNGKKYECDRLAVSQMNSNNYSHHKYVAGKYKEGDIVTAYISPVDPRVAVLERSGGFGGIGALLGMGLFGLVGLVLVGGGIWTVFSLFRTSAKDALSFEGHRLRRSRGWLFIGAFALVWNVFSWSFVFAFVGEEQFKRMEPGLLAVAIFPLVGLLLLGIFVYMVVRELRAPRLALSLTCAMWKPGSPAQVEWSLENADEIESLEINLEGSRTEGSGKHSRTVVVSSQTCCRHDQSMVPGAGSFGLAVPGKKGGATSWALEAKVKSKSSRRPFAFSYPLPGVDD